jgi:hypothetical protein
MWIPIALIVCSTVVYQLGQRAIPADANALVATMAAYLVAMTGTLLAMPFFMGGVPVGASWRALNYGSLLVGLGAFGIEVGFLLAYRAGWGISTVSMVANTMVAVALLMIGAFAFREVITGPRILGIAFCGVGLWLVTRPAAA